MSKSRAVATCTHCRQSIIYRHWNGHRAWTHQHTGNVNCRAAFGTTAKPHEPGKFKNGEEPKVLAESKEQREEVNDHARGHLGLVMGAMDYWPAETPPGHCKTCGCPPDKMPMVFRGTGWCCENHRKEQQGG